ATPMLNPASGRGRIWYEKPDGRVEETSSDGRFKFVGDSEAAVLSEFWKAMGRFQRFVTFNGAGFLSGVWKAVRRFRPFVTFNGRGFDGRFLMRRSAALGIAASRNLVGYR